MQNKCECYTLSNHDATASILGPSAIPNDQHPCACTIALDWHCCLQRESTQQIQQEDYNKKIVVNVVKVNGLRLAPCRS